MRDVAVVDVDQTSVTCTGGARLPRAARREVRIRSTRPVNNGGHPGGATPRWRVVDVFLRVALREMDSIPCLVDDGMRPIAMIGRRAYLVRRRWLRA